MLFDVSPKVYYTHFSENPHPYISSAFIELNKNKTDRVVRLLENETKVSIGLVAGIKDGVLLSPFSAPFGGFHFRKDNQYISELESFAFHLIQYGKYFNLKRIEITLPPDIYHLSFNTKMFNVLLRNGFNINIPEITNWLNLNDFTGVFSNRGARKYYKQALYNNLSFRILEDRNEKHIGFNIICENRARFGRPIYMTYEDLDNTNSLWPVDFFGAFNTNNEMVAAGVFYRGHEKIIQGIFWGDSEEGRPLRAIDFLALNIWNHYKNLGFAYIDLGISTKNGIPNEGLIRFKESHDCDSALRFTLSFDFEK